MIFTGVSAARGGPSTAIAANAAMAIQSTAKSRNRLSRGVVVVTSATRISDAGAMSHHLGEERKE